MSIFGFRKKKEEQKKPIYNRNNFTLIRKIKEVISNAN